MEDSKASETFAIILGASKYPEHSQLPERASFLASAEAFRQYLLAPDGLAIPSENLLWLFDSPLGNREQLLQIDNFIHSANALRTRRAAPQIRGLDLVVLYVGHGAYWQRDEFYLTPKTVVENKEQVTSIRFADFAHVINTFGGRRYIVLDCCYAAAAARHLQALGPPPSLGSEGERHFPKSGTALLAASSKDSPAQAPEDAEYTLFSDALQMALSGKLPRPEGGVYSMHTLHHAISDYIQFHHASSGVQPEIHVPKQTAGDISDRPVFRVRSPRSPDQGHLDQAISQLRRDLDALTSTVAGLPAQTHAIPHSGNAVLWISLALSVTAMAGGLWSYLERKRPVAEQPIIAIQTDYGSHTYYMGALIGRIYRSDANARVQVLTADIDNFDLVESAWSLWQASRFYPSGTIFVSIINPGGLASSPPRVIVTNNNFIFVGPDNGNFDFVVQNYGHRVSYTIANKMLSPVDFRDGGLDYFGPTAAALASGFSLEDIGPKTTTYVPKLPNVVHEVSAQRIAGTVMSIDKFGNVITDISNSDLDKAGLRAGMVLVFQAGGRRFKIPFADTYSKVPTNAMVAILNDGSLQFAINMGNFALAAAIKRQERIDLAASD
jgi:S-adenosylmethionine hydrolase